MRAALCAELYEPNDCTHMHGHHEADYFMDGAGWDYQAWVASSELPYGLDIEL